MQTMKFLYGIAMFRLKSNPEVNNTNPCNSWEIHEKLFNRPHVENELEKFGYVIVSLHKLVMCVRAYAREYIYKKTTYQVLNFFPTS